MPGRVQVWPPWREFSRPDKTSSKDPDFLTTKQHIIAQYGESVLRKSWLQVCHDLVSITDEIASNGSNIIPVFNATEVLKTGFTNGEKTKIKQIGCFVVRGVIPEQETRDSYQDLQKYIADNRQRLRGWPRDSPCIWNMYHSPAQVTIRTHPRQLRLQRILNELWHDASGETSSEPLAYLDAVRDRQPGQIYLGLGPHIDAGSFCRWADPGHRKIYEPIFLGNPRSLDCYDLQLRKGADQHVLPGVAHNTVFRTFQGWTALTRQGSGEGSLWLYPNVQTVIAYVLLRPFFSPPASESDVMDPSKWIFNHGSDWFPGTYKEDSQMLSPSSHPHLRLKECLVDIPSMMPGDTVWWHVDMCHAVDAEHNGTENACVAYVAACPTTPINKSYIKTQLECVIAGRPPPDFDDNILLNETAFIGYPGYEGLSEEAKAAMGFYL